MLWRWRWMLLLLLSFLRQWCAPLMMLLCVATHDSLGETMHAVAVAVALDVVAVVVVSPPVVRAVDGVVVPRQLGRDHACRGGGVVDVAAAVARCCCCAHSPRQLGHLYYVSSLNESKLI